MNLLRALATVSSLTLVSRILGYVRDFIIARAFGVSAGTDAFLVAFRIPNLLRRLFAEGAFSQAFVPVLAAEKAKDEQSVRSLIDGVATLLFLALIAAAATGVLLAPLVVYVSAPGFARDPGKFDLTVPMPKGEPVLLNFAKDNGLRVREGRTEERTKLAELQRVGDTA